MARQQETDTNAASGQRSQHDPSDRKQSTRTSQQSVRASDQASAVLDDHAHLVLSDDILRHESRYSVRCAHANRRKWIDWFVWVGVWIQELRGGPNDRRIAAHELHGSSVHDHWILRGS